MSLAITIALAISATGAGAPFGPAAPDRWIGRWTGGAGRSLDVLPRGAAGRYRLALHGQRGTEQFAGRADGDGIRFTRGDGRPDRLAPMPHGARSGREPCLLMRSGEAFCRK